MSTATFFQAVGAIILVHMTLALKQRSFPVEDIPHLAPRNKTAGQHVMWQHIPDPAQFGNDPRSFVENVEFQVGVNLPPVGSLLSWDSLGGFPDWRHCLVECKLLPWCEYWVFKYDPETYDKDMGGCDLSTGPLNYGHSPHGVQTVGGSRSLRGGVGVDEWDADDDDSQRSNPHWKQWDIGFSYVLEGLLHPEVYGRRKAESAEACAERCVAAPENCVAWQFSNHPWSLEEECVLLESFNGKYQNDPFVTSALREGEGRKLT